MHGLASSFKPRPAALITEDGRGFRTGKSAWCKVPGRGRRRSRDEGVICGTRDHTLLEIADSNKQDAPEIWLLNSCKKLRGAENAARGASGARSPDPAREIAARCFTPVAFSPALASPARGLPPRPPSSSASLCASAHSTPGRSPARRSRHESTPPSPLFGHASDCSPSRRPCSPAYPPPSSPLMRRPCSPAPRPPCSPARGGRSGRSVTPQRLFGSTAFGLHGFLASLGHDDDELLGIDGPSDERLATPPFDTGRRWSDLSLAREAGPMFSPPALDADSAAKLRGGLQLHAPVAIRQPENVARDAIVCDRDASHQSTRGEAQEAEREGWLSSALGVLGEGWARWSLTCALVIGAFYLLGCTPIGKRFWRTADFWKRALPVFFAYKGTQRRVREMDGEKANAEWEATHERGSKELYQLCVDARGMFIKAAQVFGARTDMLPPAYTTKLRTLYDQVPPQEPATIRRVIERELGKPLEELFESFDPEPLGSASIAQVHSAVTRDGERVAVKVQHEGAEEIMALDLGNLELLGRLIQREDLGFDLVSAVRELKEQLPLEFDFQREAEMMSRMRESLANHLPGIVLPRPVAAAKRCLVMSFLDGTRILDAAPHMAPGAVGKHMEALCALLGHQLFIDGVFHADPHPGNLLILHDGRLGLLDFGQCKELALPLRQAFARHVLALANNDAGEIVTTFHALGIETAYDDMPFLVPIIARTMFDTAPMPWDDVSPFSPNNASKRNPVKHFPPELFMVLRANQIMRGLFHSLNVDVSVVKIWAKYAKKLLFPDAGSIGASLRSLFSSFMRSPAKSESGPGTPDPEPVSLGSPQLAAAASPGPDAPSPKDTPLEPAPPRSPAPGSPAAVHRYSLK
eukprot:tig00000808_g4425.t1